MLLGDMKKRFSSEKVLLWPDEKLPCKRRKGKRTLKTVSLKEPEDTLAQVPSQAHTKCHNKNLEA